jgi:NAD(P)-dependent dehydrogenase (short-subunit alcohol dehydrogenase family)
MNGRLGGKIAVITGATLGIGRTTAERFAAEGAKLVLVARRADLGEELVSLLGKDRASFVAGNVANPITAAKAIEIAISKGGLDILVNNAGIDFTSDLLETDLEDVRHVFEVNFIGAFLMLKEAARTMRSSGKGGSIINVTSRTASVGVSTMSIYGATKGALLSLTRGAAIDLAKYSIRVNAVAPGLTQTPLFEAWLAAQPDPERFKDATAATIPQHRFASPEDVASAILYFASDESAHVTGASLAVDGGYTAA